MEVILCHVNEWFQVGKSSQDFVTAPQIIRIPKHWEGDTIMPMSDIKIHTKGSCSARYQTVHFGVEVVVKDVPYEEAEAYQDELQAICFERLDNMEPRAQEMLTTLLRDQF
jgi:hypothetical protein